MTFDVRLHEIAYSDLTSIYDWVANAAGHDTATAYEARIRAKLLTLEMYPSRGTPREAFGAGLRSIGFEQRLIIYYRIVGQTVTVMRIVDGARDQAPLFNT